MKRFFALALALACLLALSGCAPSPTAVTVGGRKVDASEYAFYLHYNCDAHEDESVPYTDAETAAARAKALEQITTGEVVCGNCLAADEVKGQLDASHGDTTEYYECSRCGALMVETGDQLTGRAPS